uniref:Uncharacterized protein n=1 Tax=Picea glauca TaxID=3330 RepID=A0A117NJE8_PICGL|nr:hypothetical protein ABT39_MTgene1286 [Picea glauca]
MGSECFMFKPVIEGDVYNEYPECSKVLDKLFYSCFPPSPIGIGGAACELLSTL